MHYMFYKTNGILAIALHIVLKFLAPVKSTILMCKLVKSFCASELLSATVSFALLHLFGSDWVTKILCALLLHFLKSSFRTGDCLYRKLVCDGTSYHSFVTEIWDFSVSEVSSFLRDVLALNFSKWHDTLHPFWAFDILNCFCVMDDLPWWAMDSGDLIRKTKLSPFAKHSTSKFTWGETLHYTTFSFFLQYFFVPISLLIYVSFFQTLLLRMSLMLAKE